MYFENKLSDIGYGRSPYRNIGGDIGGVEFIIGKNVKNIPPYVFSDAFVYPKSFIFEEGSKLETIGSNAFEEVEAIGNIIFPNTLKRIEERAFKNCKNFNTPEFPSSLEYIGYQAFYFCESLTCKKPQASDTLEIGSAAFLNCVNMQE